MITVDDAPKQLNKKLAAVVSEKLEAGMAMNALAHMALGMGTVLGSEEGLMCDYIDGNGLRHPSISAYPFIVLKGRPGKIREAVSTAQNTGIKAVDFVNTMTAGSYTEQLTRTKATKNEELEYYGAVFFGDFVPVNEITKKFSLYK